MGTIAKRLLLLLFELLGLKKTEMLEPLGLRSAEVKYLVDTEALRLEDTFLSRVRSSHLGQTVGYMWLKNGFVWAWINRR